MTTRTVPEKKIIICDCCQREVGDAGVWRAKNGGIHVRRDALDYQGSACANADIRLDLCDGCLGKVCDAINAACVEVRAALTEARNG